MEVVNAVGPGARVRVMRAAYHSSSGPGIPASSYMLHSSRRVISSGFNLLESPSVPTKPLEISSTPLEPFRDLSAETENYKVTEPDDTEISEPSKWRASGSSIRMPSEESSSTDNASIIDVSHKNVFRKYSYDSENSDFQPSKKTSSRASPLLDSPVTLSTLKYKSLLNGTNDWNNRRKSYSFEDTCPVNETILHSNDTLAMESSTDSGICKSTEIVNSQGDDNAYSNYIENKAKNYDRHDETFRDWLHKNRPSSFYKGTQLKACKEYDIPTENTIENTITLQSPGKVSITVPITIERDETRHTSDDTSDRKVKKVEFCKTELHFAAESGKVNIIATDEKPPPSNDFRKRRSAFVPITDKFEKPITLFGEKSDTMESIKISSFSINSGTNDFDDNENTAATKSILKNKIPKPKPYLLGENMVYRNSDNIADKDRNDDTIVPTGVSLINKQLQTERNYINEKNISTSNPIETSIQNNYERTVINGPQRTTSSKLENVVETESNTTVLQSETNMAEKGGSVRNKLLVLPISPVQKPKTRKLRESDLMYFGIDDGKNSIKDKTKYVESVLTSCSSITDDIFQSVKLIKRISNSACNSEAESDDTPEYQNVPMKINFAPIPTPRPRSKYEKTTEVDPDRTLQPILEQSAHATNVAQEYRRSRSRKYEDLVVPTPRSRSEPAHKRSHIAIDKMQRHDHVHMNNLRDSSSRRSKIFQEHARNPKVQTLRKTHNSSISEDETPLYINIKEEDQRTPKQNYNSKTEQNHSHVRSDHMNDSKMGSISRATRHAQLKTEKTDTADSHKSVKKSHNIQRTKKLVTPENSFCIQSKNEEGTLNSSSSSHIKTRSPTVHNHAINDKNSLTKSKHKHSLSSQRHSNKMKESKDKIAFEAKPAIATIVNEEVVKQSTNNRKKYTSTDPKNSRKEALKSHDEDIKCNPANGGEIVMSAKKTSHRTPKRSEYVINYDDKNGTVSSVCKVKAGHSISKRKSGTKDSPTEMKLKNKTLDKTPLLELPGRQWNQNGFTHEPRKWKTKIHVQKSCQLL